MNRIKNLQRWIIFAVLCALLISPTQPGRAQQPQQTQTPQTITGYFNATLDVYTMSFDPNGGPITFQINPPGGEDDGTCDLRAMRNITISGTFAGGDGGVASGTFTSIYIAGVPYCEHQTEDDMSGPWTGNFYSNGTGSGTLTLTGEDGYIYDFKWWASYSAAEFQAALAPPVTSEYIYTTYGIRVEDSFGGDEYAQTAWSDHELSLLNDVLKELPPDMLKNMALTSIIRNKVKIDEKGNQKPNIMGTYYPCGSDTGKDCSGSSAVIRIFDKSTLVNHFADDPTGDKDFKANILHEMIHALQSRRDQYSEYADSTKSPLVRNYMDATRPNTYREAGGPDAGIAGNGWGNYWGVGWALYDEPGNKPPTNYGKASPLEDMSESVEMYVNDPQRLKASSMARYNFIRDLMFGGVEYENGIQKKP